MKTLRIGDKVAFGTNFLRSIHTGPKDSIRTMRGVITSLSFEVRPGVRLCSVWWDDATEKSSLTVNLRKVS